MTDASCQRCGVGLVPGAAFCENCGNPVAPTPATRPSTFNAEPSAAWRSATGREFSQPVPTVPSALMGAAVPNDTYLGNRLVYGPVEDEIDPVSNAEFLRLMLIRAAAFFVLWLVGQLLLFLVFGIAGIGQLASAASQSFDYSGYSSSSDDSSSPLFVVWTLLGTLFTLGWWALFWWTRINVPISEWMLTVDGKGDAAPKTLEHMNNIVIARQLPVACGLVELRSRRHGRRFYLQLVDGVFAGFVCSFAYGTDMYIGWTFSLSQTPGRWLLSVFARTFRAVTLRGASLGDLLAWDTAKAMREVMHSAVRQGVDVATDQIEVSGSGRSPVPGAVFDVPW